jgi:hypothetical protein
LSFKLYCLQNPTLGPLRHSKKIHINKHYLFKKFRLPDWPLCISSGV